VLLEWESGERSWDNFDSKPRKRNTRKAWQTYPFGASILLYIYGYEPMIYPVRGRNWVLYLDATAVGSAGIQGSDQWVIPPTYPICGINPCRKTR